MRNFRHKDTCNSKVTQIISGRARIWTQAVQGWSGPLATNQDSLWDKRELPHSGQAPPYTLHLSIDKLVAFNVRGGKQSWA